MFHTTNSNSVSVSAWDTPQTHNWSSHYQSYTPSAHPDNSHTGPGPPALYYMWKHPYPIFGTSQVNRLCSTHVYLFSIPQYSHAWSKYHMFTFLLLLWIPLHLSLCLPFSSFCTSRAPLVSSIITSCFYLSLHASCSLYLWLTYLVPLSLTHPCFSWLILLLLTHSYLGPILYLAFPRRI